MLNGSNFLSVRHQGSSGGTQERFSLNTNDQLATKMDKNFTKKNSNKDKYFDLPAE